MNTWTTHTIVVTIRDRRKLVHFFNKFGRMLRDGMQPSLMELDVRYGGIILVIEHLVRRNHKDNCHIKHVDRSDGMMGQETYGYKERS